MVVEVANLKNKKINSAIIRCILMTRLSSYASSFEFFEQKKSSSAFQEYSVNKIYHLFVFAVDVDKLHG